MEGSAEAHSPWDGHRSAGFRGSIEEPEKFGGEGRLEAR